MKPNLFVLLFLLICLPSTAHSTCIGLGCSCSVSSTGINFGTYNPTSGSPKTSQGNVRVQCSALVLTAFASYTIALNAGQGTFTNRKMINGANQLLYNIYTTNAYSNVWGDGTGSTSLVSDSFNFNVSIISAKITDYPTYGSIPISQFVAAVSYTDTITVTVTY